MTIHSNIHAWRILWTEEPDGLQFMGSQRVGHNLVTEYNNNILSEHTTDIRTLPVSFQEMRAYLSPPGSLSFILSVLAQA